MSTYQELAASMREHLKEDAAAPSGSATTMDAISFLPSRMGDVRTALKGLRKKKTKWGLEVQESDEAYTVKFEDQLTIEVLREHWDEFQGMFDGSIDNDAYFDLQVQIQDRVQLSEDQIIEDRKEELLEKLEEVFRPKEVQLAEKVVEHWTCIMGCAQNLTESMKAIVPLHKVEEFIENYSTKILQENEDLGSLEIAIESLDFEVVAQMYNDSQCLAGARFQAVHEGVEAIFEARISFDKDCSFTIRVSDPEIVDILEEAYVGLPRINNVIYPRVGQILGSEGIFETLKEVISDNIQKEDEGEETDA
jgi:hypothetical protein